MGQVHDNQPLRSLQTSGTSEQRCWRPYQARKAGPSEGQMANTKDLKLLPWYQQFCKGFWDMNPITGLGGSRIPRWERLRSSSLMLGVRVDTEHTCLEASFAQKAHFFILPALSGEVITGLNWLRWQELPWNYVCIAHPRFALHVCHRPTKTTNFSAHYSLRMLLFTFYIRLRNMSVINIQEYDNTMW